MPEADTDLSFALPRHTKVLLVMDVVESVRLMELDENGFVRRWQALVQHTEQVLPAHGGRIVKSLGDGLLLEFSSARSCTQAALGIQAFCRQANAGLAAERQMNLRMGAHVAAFVADKHDIYGTDVNLSARLTTLAGPGELVVSSELRGQLTPVLDGDIEDLGECFLKHVKEPVRVYRVGPPGAEPVVRPPITAEQDLRPTIAVIPFAVRTSDAGVDMVGEALADEVIASLSRTAELHVISRLSTTQFQDKNSTGVSDIREHLGARYVLSGTCRVAGQRMALFVELIDSHSGKVVWADNLKGEVHGLFSADDELVARLVSSVSTAVMTHQVERSKTQSLPSLESYTLMLGAVSMMHRTSFAEFERARAMLEHLIDRSRRQPVPHAWLAKWYVMRASQGWSQDPSHDARLALDATHRALDSDPDCALALTIEGMVHSNLLKDLDSAQERHQLALSRNPNESLAWLFSGIMHAFKGEGPDALAACERAISLSPLDPLRYYYDSLAAAAAIAAGQYPTAVGYAKRSLQANRMHLSSYRSLAIAQSLGGDVPGAQGTVATLLKLEPGFTVRQFVARYPGAASSPDYTQHLAQALRSAGLPE